jgi:intracellular multiplication protein IcmJ
VITLTVAPNSWKLFIKRKADKAFPRFAKKVFFRDQHQCQFCGFCSELHMDIINRDGNYRNNTMKNMATACPLCCQCFFLDAVGKTDISGGTLIYLPEMQQEQLNALCHVLFSAVAFGHEFSNEYKDHYRRLKIRSEVVESKLGKGFSRPQHYSQMLVDAHKDVRELHQNIFLAVRLLPNLKRFAPLSKVWAQEAVEALAVA